MTKEIDISKVLIEGDIATIMGEKYKRVDEPKTPAEEAYKRVYGEYPVTYHSSWGAFQDGYDAAFFEACKEPKPTTLYDTLQCPLYTNGYHFNEGQKDWICRVVEEWLSDGLLYDGEDYKLSWNEAIQKINKNIFK